MVRTTRSALGQSGDFAFEVLLPGEEGVYDLVVAAVNNLNWSQAVREPLSRKKILAERRVQLLVLSPQRPQAGRPDAEFTQVVEIDPANPRWFEKLTKLPQLQQLTLPKPRLASFLHLWKGPLGNGTLEPYRHPLGDLVQLKPNAESSDVSWEAYSLPITQPGRPHILEVDYPSDVSQTLGISIVEPNAAGADADGFGFRGRHFGRSDCRADRRAGSDIGSSFGRAPTRRWC